VRRGGGARIIVILAVLALVVARIWGPRPSRSPRVAQQATNASPRAPREPREPLGRPAADSGCPVEGDAKIPRVTALNLLKNRTTVPALADIDTAITTAMLVAPGDDRRRFTTGKAVRVSGYVADVKVGGVETVNCKAKDPDARDTHIELTLEPMSEDGAKHLIVEVTPRWRTIVAARGEDWHTNALRRNLKGRWVEVTGWLLYDEEHEANAANTHRGKANIWRATVWEVHPITSIRVLERPPTR